MAERTVRKVRIARSKLQRANPALVRRLSPEDRALFSAGPNELLIQRENMIESEPLV